MLVVALLLKKSIRCRLIILIICYNMINIDFLASLKLQFQIIFNLMFLKRHPFPVPKVSLSRV